MLIYISGIRSDSDLYTFGFPWRPWKQESPIAQGKLIIDYVKESASAYGIDKNINFNHLVNTAKYSSKEKKWTIDVTANGSQSKEFHCRWMLLCTGYYDYNAPLQTTIPGIDNFKGDVIHPQFWPEELDYTGKDIVVVGSGATAVTVLPVLGEKASHVTMLQRSPSYVLSIPSEDGMERLIRRFFWWTPQVQDWMFRIKWIMMPLLMTSYSHYFPESAKKSMFDMTEKQLPSEISRDPHFTPRYNPWEQRMCMCPDGDFYKSLRSGKSSIVTDSIENITSDTIKLASGKELHPDIIVTATGLKLQFAGGMKIYVDDEIFEVPQKYAWKNVMLEDLPNAAFVVGYVDASWTLGADATAQLVCRMLNQMRNEGAVEVTPKRSDEEKKSMHEMKLLRLSSTYIEKGKDIIPKAGDQGQWLPRSNYLKDIAAAWYGDIKTDAVWVKG